MEAPVAEAANEVVADGAVEAADDADEAVAEEAAADVTDEAVADEAVAEVVVADAAPATAVAKPAAKPRVAATAGETSMTSRMLLARLPRGATQGRCRRPRPAVCSDVTNQVGPYSPSRARAMASALVDPTESKAASR